MKILKLQLENFRNHKSYLFEFGQDKNITILSGLNGKGKTNLIEAIYVLSLGKSFRTSTYDNLISWDLDYLRCSCITIVEEEEEKLEFFYSNYPRKQKGLKHNDVSLKNSEYIGNLLTVLFHPEDLNMLYLSPSYRRRYLNILLSQIDRKYLNALFSYNKILKQRNALLQEIRKMRFKRFDTDVLEKDLDAWDQELVQFGTLILEKRGSILEFLNKTTQSIYQNISSGKENVRITYQSKVLTPDTPDLAESYKEKLLLRREKDIREAKTGIGPHRDDILFEIKGKDILKSASRGEFRTLLLAIKLAEIQIIKQKTGKLPILLLDDVFSELDIERQKHLLEAIKDCQAIITTTEIENVENIAATSENMRFVKLE